MFEVNYRREKNNKRSAAPFMTLLVNRFLSFICISYPLRVFKKDSEWIADTNSKNLEQTPTEYSFYMSDFVFHVCLQ